MEPRIAERPAAAVAAIVSDGREETPRHRDTAGEERRLARGVLMGLLAEGLALPTGLLTAAFLGRALGPAGYGLFALAASLVGLIEWAIGSLFSRSTIKLVGESHRWTGIAATAFRWQLAAGVAVAAILWVAAPRLAMVFDVPELAPAFRLFAFELPAFSLFAASRNVLAGRGLYGRRALASAARWTSRLLLVVLFVSAGMSVHGAILGSIGALIVGWAVSPLSISLIARRGEGTGRLLGYALPLFLLVLSLRLYEKLGLFALKLLGGTVEEAGVYAAAQNLAIVPLMMAQTATPLLLAALSRARRDADAASERRMVGTAIRLTAWSLPFAAVVSGAAGEVMSLVYGPSFFPGGPVAAILMLGSVATILVSVNTTVLIAADRAGLALVLSAPLVLLAVAGYLAAIPALGGIGAALVTSGLAALAAGVMTTAALGSCNVPFPGATAWRVVIVGCLAWLVTAAWPSSGAWLVVKMSAVSAGILVLMMATRELSLADIKSLYEPQLARQPEARDEAGQRDFQAGGWL
jgi:O-antigen/teichoic acid export membrane protein